MQSETLNASDSKQDQQVPLLKWLLPILVIVGVIFIDQYLKYWVKHNMVLHTEKPIAGSWFLFHFTENNGMAFGIEFAGKYGKLILSIFRIAVSMFGFWYLYKAIQRKANTGFLVCVALILAGAIGNIIDCFFYGVWYHSMNEYEGGYLLGRVVDMLYFPIIETHYPEWFPFKAGQQFTFFSPVFNIADTAISTGVIAILVFQKKYFKKDHESEQVETPVEVDPTSVTEELPPGEAQQS